MGYTHYWTQTADFSRAQWLNITAHIRAILDDAEQRYEIRLADGMGERGTRPEFEPDHLRFNGSGDQAHETFVVYRVRPPKESWQPRRGMDFCKTARKPYDTAVTAVLCYLASFQGKHRVSSDGRGRDFLSGLELARQALPNLANQLDLPMGVMEDDRWCPPFVHLTTDAYRFRCCVDGHAYVEQVRSPRRSYRFASHAEAARFLRDHADLFDATGIFDELRRRAVSRRQNEVLRALIAEGEREPPAPGRCLPPPAFTRPDEFPPIAPVFTFAELLGAA
jgi:hypothetical protein